MSKELGTLIVVVLKARNLNDKHSFYKQDVFAQVSLNGVYVLGRLSLFPFLRVLFKFYQGVNKRTPVDVKGTDESHTIGVFHVANSLFSQRWPAPCLGCGNPIPSGEGNVREVQKTRGVVLGKGTKNR